MTEHNREIIAAGKHLQLVCEAGWEYAERRNVGGVVVIVAITEDDRIVLTEQYRVPVHKRVIDLPAGLAGDIPEFAGEALAEAARRELLEETGYACRQMLYLAHGPTSAGMSSEQITYFRAIGLEKVGPGGGDGSENIEIHEVPLSSVHEWIAGRNDGRVAVDLKLYAGLYFAGHQFGGGGDEIMR